MQCQCFNCGRVGHLERDCRSPQSGNDLGMSAMATRRPRTSVINAQIRGVYLEAMLDSGSTISFLWQDMVPQIFNPVSLPLPPKWLVTASGQTLDVVGCVLLPVAFQDKPPVLHQFVIVPDLIIAAILGVDFLQKHADFSTDPVFVLPRGSSCCSGASNGKSRCESTV